MKRIVILVGISVVSLSLVLGSGFAQQTTQSQTGSGVPVVQPKEPVPAGATKAPAEIPKASPEIMRKETAPAKAGAEVKSEPMAPAKDTSGKAVTKPDTLKAGSKGEAGKASEVKKAVGKKTGKARHAKAGTVVKPKKAVPAHETSGKASSKSGAMKSGAASDTGKASTEKASSGKTVETTAPAKSSAEVKPAPMGSGKSVPDAGSMKKEEPKPAVKE